MQGNVIDVFVGVEKVEKLVNRGSLYLLGRGHALQVKEDGGRFRFLVRETLGVSIRRVSRIALYLLAGSPLDVPALQAKQVNPSAHKGLDEILLHSEGQLHVHILPPLQPKERQDVVQSVFGDFGVKTLGAFDHHLGREFTQVSE